MGAVYPDEWISKVAFMRDHSLTSATWSPDGAHLTSAEAAPVPSSDAPTEQDKQSQSPVERERARLAEMRRVAFAASGGPRPRVVDRT
jgi:hypothetical protein